MKLHFLRKFALVTNNLIVVNQHVRQMFHSSVLDRLWFRLLGVAVVRCESDFRRIIETKMLTDSFNNIVIGVKLWPRLSQSRIGLSEIHYDDHKTIKINRKITCLTETHSSRLNSSSFGFSKILKRTTCTSINKITNSKGLEILDNNP